MRYQLWIEDEAKAEIRRLPGHMRQRIHQAVQGLSDEPRPHYSRKLRTPERIKHKSKPSWFWLVQVRATYGVSCAAS